MTVTVTFLFLWMELGNINPCEPLVFFNNLFTNMLMYFSQNYHALFCLTICTKCRMRSIIDHLKQSRAFTRLRIGTAIIYFFYFSRQVWNMIPPKKCCAGIGRPPEELGAIGFVLRSFTKQEKEEVCTRLHCTIWMHANLLHHYSCDVFLKQTVVS